MRCEIIELTKL